MKFRILVADDEELNREMLEDYLTESYDIDQASDGMQAVEMLEDVRDGYAAVLLDLQMPKLDGFGVLEQMKRMGLSEVVPVLVITGDRSLRVESKCFDYGVSDFIGKPFDPFIIRKRVKNIVHLFEHSKQLEAEVDKQTQTIREQYELLRKQAEKLRETNHKIIEVLGTVVENRNLESGEHIYRVKRLTGILARKMMENYPEYGLTEHLIQVIVEASPLHDVGKIAISDSILLKPGRLTPEEFAVMKKHTTRGAKILESVPDIWDEEYKKISYEICLYHHEKYDGKGYPEGRRGEEIPIAAQLVSLADVYDALVSKRVYKDAYSKEEAYQMILRGECGAFSPKLLHCLQLAKEEFASA